MNRNQMLLERSAVESMKRGQKRKAYLLQKETARRMEEARETRRIAARIDALLRRLDRENRGNNFARITRAAPKKKRSTRARKPSSSLPSSWIVQQLWKRRKRTLS